MLAKRIRDRHATTPEVALSSAKSGLSDKVSLITSPMTISTALNRKGIRHPQDKNWSSGSCDTKKNANVAVAVPAGAPSCGNAP